MKPKSINDVGSGRLGRVIKDLWLIIQVQHKAPGKVEMEMLCNMNGIVYSDMSQLLDVVAQSWKNEERV